MVTVRRVGPVLGLAIGLIVCTGFARAQNLPRWPLVKAGQNPETFGITDDEITVISAMSLVPDNNGFAYGAAGFGRYSQVNADVLYFTTLNIPAGAVIDFIGVNSLTDTDGVLGVGLWQRYDSGSTSLLTGFSLPSHPFTYATDYSGPLNISYPSHKNNELVLEIENAPNPNPQYFLWIEVWWHRTVSPSPPTATFADVPTSSPIFKFVEALHAAGITAGCGGGNFCPNSAVTRGQMAVFLATALGLHWPS